MDIEKRTFIPEFWTAHSTFSDHSIPFVFSGVAPTGVELDTFDYAISGEILRFSFELRFNVAGVLNTSLSFRLPADEDSLLTPEFGRGSGSALVVAFGQSIVLEAVDGEPFEWKCWLSKNALEQYTVNLSGDAKNVKSVFGYLSYHR